ncbi:MAG: ABC transporter permease [Anaerolineales bacterium]|jgi:ABC-2 type transport system permease protein
MKKIWLIAKTTYKQRLRSGTFLILTFALPVLMVIAGAIPFISNMRGDALPPVGYVDQTGQLAPPGQVRVEDQTLQLKSYENPDQARDAYQAGEIAGYLVIPEGYFEGQGTRYYAGEAPNEYLTEGLRIFMRLAMLPDAPDWALQRLADPANRTFVALDSGEQMQEGIGLIFRFAAPAGLAILLALALLFTSSQMGAAVVREKDQRAMEMIITSLKPSQLIAGKVMGMSLLSLTQIAVWGFGALIGVGLLLAGQVDLGNISVPWGALLWAVLLGVPGYFLYAVIASGIGIIAGDSQQAQQLAGFLGFLGMAPLWIAGALLNAPNSGLAVALTLFPLTGPILALLRMALTEVPLWQLGASFGLLVLSLVAGIWAVSRLFRVAMLMYGQALGPREIVRAMRQA